MFSIGDFYFRKSQCCYSSIDSEKFAGDIRLVNQTFNTFCFCAVSDFNTHHCTGRHRHMVHGEQRVSVIYFGSSINGDNRIPLWKDS